jgi:NADP-dependent 3-hydroxy acid dehydrogenase YdfG
LARGGAALCLPGRDRPRLEEAEAAIRTAGARDVLAVQTDLTDEKDLKRLSGLISDRFGDIDVLVHSAGAYARAPLETATIVELDALYAANLRAPYRLTQLCLPALCRRTGDILFINSTQGLSASASVGQFAATQHALKAVADSLRDEINTAGVRVTTLHVGSTATPRQERIFKMTGRRYVPDRLLQADDVASAVVAVLRLPRTAEVTNLTIRPMQKA